MAPLPQSASRLARTTLSIVGHPAFLPACVAIHIALRLLVIALAPVEPTSDAAWYYYRAIDIADGKGYIKGSGETTAFWPIGYPGFLAALFYVFGSDLIVVKLANLGLSLVSLWALHSFAKSVAGSTAARMAVLAFAIYPNAVSYIPIVWSETLFTTLLLLGCRSYATSRSLSSIVLAGIWFGAASLVKTQAVLMPPMLVGAALLFHPERRFRMQTVTRGIVFGIATLATIAPWTIRNYLVFDQFVLVSTNGGMSLLAGNNPSFKPDYERNYNADDELVRSAGHPHAPELEVDVKARRLAVDWIKNNPGDFARLIPHKFFRLWAIDGEGEWAYQANKELYEPRKLIFRTVRILNWGYYGLAILLAFASIVLLRRVPRSERPDAWIWIGWLFAIYFTLLCLVFSGQSRYHAPLMPLLFINAAVSLCILLRLPSRTDGVDTGAADTELKEA